MPDMLSPLAAANGLHESFHSSHSSPPGTHTEEKPANTHTAALQAAGLPVCGVDEYLDDPNNQLLLQDAVTSKKRKNSGLTNDQSIGSPSSAAEPVPLGGSKTSHHVKMLYELCQSCGLQLEFDIGGDQLSFFGGSVSINGESVHSDQRWPNKKEAKEGLAEKGMELARRLAQNGKPAAAAAATEPQVNWIGRLLGKEAYKQYG